MKRVLATLGVATVLLTGAAIGQEYPTTGVAYNTRETNFMTYDCQKRPNENRIDCKFIQISIRKQAKPEDLQKRLSKAKKQFPEYLKVVTEKPEACEEILGALATVPTNSIYFGPAKAMAEFCKRKDEKSFLAITERRFEIDSRTCTVGPNPFEQSFTWIDGYNGKGAWVVDEGPQGTCGLVQLSRFEIEESGPFKFWNYIARKAITNPEGEMLMGQRCGDLDQTEYLYNTEKPEYPRLGCEWMDYSQY